jgi:hypothetical protein
MEEEGRNSADDGRRRMKRKRRLLSGAVDLKGIPRYCGLTAFQRIPAGIHPRLPEWKLS